MKNTFENSVKEYSWEKHNTIKKYNGVKTYGAHVEHSNVVEVRTQWQLEDLSGWHPDVVCHHHDGYDDEEVNKEKEEEEGDKEEDEEEEEEEEDNEKKEEEDEEEPVFDLHGPLVKDQHRTCGDHKQDRDKLKNQQWEKY